MHLQRLMHVDNSTWQTWVSLAEHAGLFLFQFSCVTNNRKNKTSALELWQVLAETGSSDLEDTLGGAVPFEAWVRYGSAGPATASSQASAHPGADPDGAGSPTGPATPAAGGGSGAPWDFAQAAATLAPAEMVLQCARQVSAAALGQHIGV